MFNKNCLGCGEDSDKKKTYSQYELTQHNSATLFKAVTSPETYSEIRFPSLFPIPTYVYRTKTSIQIKTNSLGNALVEVHFGQFCDLTSFKSGKDGNKNGTSNIGNSNVFVCDHPTLDGKTPVSPDADVMMPNDVVTLQWNDLFTSVRPGPASVTYKYIGDLQTVKGTILMGFANSTVKTPTGAATPCEGLLPDPTYSLAKYLQDSMYAKEDNLINPMKAIYVPTDINQLSLRAPYDATSPFVNLRLYIFIQAGPQDAQIGQLTFTQNWEGVPSPKYSDIAKLSMSDYPEGYVGTEVFNYIKKNGLMITRDDSEYGDATAII